jgi:hypothetical protein
MYRSSTSVGFPDFRDICSACRCADKVLRASTVFLAPVSISGELVDIHAPQGTPFQPLCALCLYAFWGKYARVTAAKRQLSSASVL